MKEYLDVVDENGKPTGQTVERSVAHREGFPHRTSHLWLVRRREGRIQVLLQKRAMTKSFPGCYDISSAGHIPAGQDFYPSAIRELREELGLAADESELITCGDMKIVWDDVFFLWADVDEDQMTLQKEEVDAVLWIDLEECIERVAAGTIQNCISLEELNLVQAAAEASA